MRLFRAIGRQMDKLRQWAGACYGWISGETAMQEKLDKMEKKLDEIIKEQKEIRQEQKEIRQEQKEIRQEQKEIRQEQEELHTRIDFARIKGLVYKLEESEGCLNDTKRLLENLIRFEQAGKKEYSFYENCNDEESSFFNNIEFTEKNVEIEEIKNNDGGKIYSIKTTVPIEEAKIFLNNRIAEFEEMIKASKNNQERLSDEIKTYENQPPRRLSDASSVYGANAITKC